jgi:hypothetical protein
MPDIIIDKQDAHFTSQLTVQDRDRLLRAIEKKVDFQHYPTELLTDLKTDKLIDAWGPETAPTVLKQAIDRKIYRE